MLRALDGQLLGKRPVPAHGTTNGDHGPIHVLVWEVIDANGGESKKDAEASSKPVVTLRDIWSGDVKWTYTFAPGPRVPWSPTRLGVLETRARFLLVRLADGRKLVEQRLDPEKDR